MSRMRHIKGTTERLAASPLVIHKPHALQGQWHTLFAQNQPLVLEIGCGRGRFLYEAAKANPQKQFIGIDLVPEILMEAIDRYQKTKDFPNTIRYLWLDAEHLDEIFAPGEVSELYLHFSDPWPKNRHAKRRLTHPRFLDIYRYILASTGHLTFKTDSSPFYHYSLQEFKKAGWSILHATDDLYTSPVTENIPTEYERRYVRQGRKICRLVAAPPNDKLPQ